MNFEAEVKHDIEALRIMGLLARTHPRRGWEFVEFQPQPVLGSN